MITIIGLGFVGLTTALGFCSKGFTVYGVDIDPKKISLLKKKRIPFEEPHLKEALTKHLNKKFFPSQDLQSALEKSKVIFFCVGTPGTDDGDADLQYLFASIESTLKGLRKTNNHDFKILVIKSTIPPLSTKTRVLPAIEQAGFIVGKTIGLANNPEFLREGRAWEDFVQPDRVVIGCSDSQTEKTLRHLYKPFKAPVFCVSFNTAEFIKYVSNSFLATLISFANEMSLIADTVGEIDITQAFKILHQDKRWSGRPANMQSYLYPGCGFGGMCLPKDLQCFYTRSKKLGFESHLLEEVITVNTKIKKFVVDKIAEATSKDQTIGILGLAFKTNTDDIRETPAKDIIKGLLEQGFTKIIAYDPIATKNFQDAYKFPIQYASSLKPTLAQSNTLVILTAWDTILKGKKLLLNKKVLDFRYCLGQD